MGEILAVVLGVAMLVGFGVGIVAYKPVRNKLIREKGYDADSEGKVLFILAVISVFLGICASDPLGTVGLIAGIGVGVALIIVLLAKRIKAVGVSDALLVTMLQVLSIIWVFFVFIAKALWKAYEGFMGNHVDVSSKKEQVSRDAQLKASLMQEYEARSAKARGASDAEAAAIAAVKKEAREYGEDA